jgi:hypothetical protein
MKPRKDWDEFDEAMKVLSRAAGDDLREFLGSPSTDPVSPEEQRRVGAAMLAKARAEGHAFAFEDGALEDGIREMKGQALEAVWDVQLSKQLKVPEKRAAVIAWIEGQTGRPLPLDPDPITGAERAI